MKTKNKRLRIIVILMLVSISFWAQNTIYRICGAWKNPYDTESYYKRNGEFVIRNTCFANDCGTYIFYYNGTGVFLNPNRIDKTEFTWSHKKDTFIYHEDVSCPWYDTFKYELSCGNKYDTLKLIKAYSRKKWRYIENFFRKHITMIESTYYTPIKTFKEDDYFAYNNRVISNQRPDLVTGHFDDDNSILYISSGDYSSFKEASIYDANEIFVFDYINKNKISSFIIEYDSSTDSIKNIFHTNDYNIKRCYDRKKKRIIYKTYNKKKKRYITKN